MTDQLEKKYDAVVVGGGAAGLNGALMLARAKRSVAVIDAGEPRNAPAEGVHGLLGHDGVAPAELTARGRAEVRGYGGHIAEGEVVDLRRDGAEFTVTLADGRAVGARRVLVTTGLVDELPEIPGLRERWGRDVVHCPYCHGWEVRDRAIGVIGSGPMSVHQALLFRQLSDDIVYITHTVPPTAGQAEQLAARGIRVVQGEVAGLETEDDELSGVRLANGTVVARDAVVVATRMVARAGFLASIGLSTVEHPSGVGVHLVTDATGRTDVPGIWAAGNVTDPSTQVGASAAAGAAAGAQINFDLVNAEVEAALVEYRASHAAVAGVVAG
ncbi:NAD(P)/FAD-dependent oxidoreductase [Nocardia bovistercoris]|uniref:NAD(P)/FAD-dependent oxidoreductase n=1 Tax=Nocardia bovistercoris TaxID=2785916 RepID=A0A931N2U9_9NOCA|nr:NAD(P)/FAD-dependent oxidoreductase [Nocardia bovistercoris]MBH0777244.1 NAD(P)/FAD-dependent oxidoreductase [Nocardia bovistercoris]